MSLEIFIFQKKIVEIIFYSYFVFEVKLSTQDPHLLHFEIRIEFGFAYMSLDHC